MCVFQPDAGPNDGGAEAHLARPGGGEAEDGPAPAPDAAAQGRHPAQERAHRGSRYYTLTTMSVSVSVSVQFSSVQDGVYALHPVSDAAAQGRHAAQERAPRGSWYYSDHDVSVSVSISVSVSVRSVQFKMVSMNAKAKVATQLKNGLLVEAGTIL